MAKKSKYDKYKKNRNKRDGEKQDDRDKKSNNDLHNSLMHMYYTVQNILSADDLEECLEYMRKSLPTTFRISGSRTYASDLNHIIKDIYLPTLKDAKFPLKEGQIGDGDDIKPPEQLSWYPDGLAWQFNVPKQILRKSPEFKRFHQFLVYETDVGNISRQEAVSMIPPLLLDVKPGDNVLDMCAAPGSKTAQLLEALHSSSISTVNSNHSKPGLLIANDADLKRSHLLIHQSSRIPSDKFMVTNLEASRFPWLQVNERVHKKDDRLHFDKILCDVPCSGDGTLRKNAGIWRTWNIGNGNGLHSLQLRILQRAMALLSSDDRSSIVYSTCSMNPIEDEAVIAAGLNSVSGFELVDLTESLPSLIRRPGLSKWKVLPSSIRNVEQDQSDLPSWDTWDAYGSNTSKQSKDKDKVCETMFCPSNAGDLHLERCMRFYPHLMDTGAFFVAKIRRVSASDVPSGSSEPAIPDLTDEERTSTKRTDDDPIIPPKSVNQRSETPPKPLNKRPKLEHSLEEDSLMLENGAKSSNDVNDGQEKSNVKEFKEPPFTFLPQDHPVVINAKEKLQLSPEFPTQNLFIHSDHPPPDTDLTAIPVRMLYLANSLVKSIIENNEYTRMRLVCAGAKVFNRQEHQKNSSGLRILEEGLQVVLPYLRERDMIEGDLEDLKPLLKETYPFLAKFREGSFREAIELSAPGNIIAKFTANEVPNDHLRHPVIFPLWKSAVSISLMVNKKFKSALSLRLFGEDISEGPEKLKTQDQKINPTHSAEAEHRDESMEDAGIQDSTIDSHAIEEGDVVTVI